MKIKQIQYSIFIIVASVCLWNCNPNKTSSGTLGETAFQNKINKAEVNNDELLTLRLVVNDTYCEQTACACIHYLAARNYDDVILKLKTQFNIDLQLIYCIEEFHLVDSIKTGKYDGAICKPWFAFRQVPEYGMKFTRIADIIDPFENTLLSGIFIVKKESPIQKPADISGKILAMGQEDSYEKYHLAMQLLQAKEIKPKRIINKSSCSEGINMLLDKEAEVAVISDYALFASCAVDLASEEGFRTIWKTEDIPLCSLILDLNKVNETNAARLQNALLQISGEALVENFKSKGFVKPMKWTPQPFEDLSN